MSITYVQNLGDVTKRPGIYILRRKQPSGVAGANVGVVGIAGVTVKGPVDKLVQITSPQRFEEVFGGRDYGSGGSLVNEVWKALLNKPFPFDGLYIARAAASDAVKASFTWETAAGGGGTAVLRIDASSVGLWGNDVAFKIEDATDGDANHFNLTIRYLGRLVKYENLDISAGNDNLAEVVGDDDGNLVTLTKLADGRPVNTAANTDGADADAFVNLGETVTGFTSVAGSNGTIADSDFTGSGKVIDLLANDPRLAGGVVFVAGRSNSAIKDTLETKAGAANDRMFLICADSDTTTESAAKTEVATRRHRRIVYCYNHPYTRDPETAQEIVTEPTAWAAAAIAAGGPNDSIARWEVRDVLTGITRLSRTISPDEYASLFQEGICALREEEGFEFDSQVTTSLVGSERYITDTRYEDYVVLSLGKAARTDKDARNTPTRRDGIMSKCDDFLEREKALEENLVEYASTEYISTQSEEEQNIARFLVRARKTGHMTFMTFEIEIGRGVKITRVEA
jgi:hypothetical protein